MSGRKCATCSSREFTEDPESHTVCTQCGHRIEDEAIKSCIEYDLFKPIGTNVESGLGARGRNRATGDSGEINRARVKREIERLATGMKLSSQHVNSAFRIYVVVQEKNFIQGRKSINVMAVALYISCRMLKTPHLLIDFADHLGVDLFKLGQYYLKIVKLVNLQLPLIDPSLFIHRFCSKLSFEDKTQQVALTAIRIVKRMKRDWMSYGRRPSGLCGAAILIAARLHGFRRSAQQILRTVKVCNDTIRKRLEVFQSLPVAALTRDEFESLNLESEEWGESDPPCFRGTQTSEPVLAVTAAPRCEPAALPMEPATDSYSDLDDDEINDIILSPEESALKRILWDHINSEWLEKQRLRDEKKLASPQKPRIKRPAKPPMETAEDPADALRKSGKLSRRTDPEALEQLWKEGEYQHSSLVTFKK